MSTNPQGFGACTLMSHQSAYALLLSIPCWKLSSAGKRRALLLFCDNDATSNCGAIQELISFLVLIMIHMRILRYI